MNILTECLICKSSVHSTVILYDDRYAYTGKYKLYQCDVCSHKQLGFSPDESILKNLYNEYYPRKNVSVAQFSIPRELNVLDSFFKRSKASAYRWVPSGVSVLDIGCGLGESVAYHQSRSCSAFGVEIDRNIKRFGDHYKFNYKIGTFKAKDFPRNYFDYITLDQVFEHVSNPDEMLQEIALVIKPLGYLLLTMPNASGFGARFFKRRWINWHAPYHLNFYCRKSIKILAEKYGFELQSIKYVTPPEWILYQLIHLVVFPDYGVKSNFWQGSMRELASSYRWYVRMVNLLHKFKVTNFISILIDMMKQGDNQVIILRYVR